MRTPSRLQLLTGVVGLTSLTMSGTTASAQRVGADARQPVRLSAGPTRATNASPAVAEAARDGDLERVRALLAQRNDVNMPLGDGMTALHWAAERGDAAMAAALLKAGAKLTPTTRNGGYTPLHIASRSGNGAVVQALLTQGADVKALTATGVTALHLAAQSGDVASVKALVARKADLNARETTWGQTPLMFAASSDRSGRWLPCSRPGPMRRSGRTRSISPKSSRSSRPRRASAMKCSLRRSRRRCVTPR